MKRYFYLSLLAALSVAWGCNGDEILTPEYPWNNGSDNPTSDNSSEATDDSVGVSSIVDIDDSDDNVSNTSFDRTISITFSSSSASVEGDEKSIVTCSGAKVTANNTTDEKIIYILSGTSSNGSFTLYSSKKQQIKLKNLNLTNPNGAAINVQSKKRCFVTLEGSNSLVDGDTYQEVSGEDMKAAFFSEGQLVFSGDGSLKVTAKGKAGITSDDYIRVLGNITLNVSSSAGHGIRGKDAIIIDNGTIEASVSANMKKGFSSDSLVRFSGGTTTIKVTGGAAYDDEDKDYTGTAGIKADQRFEMTGGSLQISNSGTGGKGISCNGSGYITGGRISINVSGSNYGSSSGRGPWGGGSSSNSVSAKGMKFDGSLYISDGVISSYSASHEAIEAKGKIEITGGEVFAQSSDDAINSGGDMVISDGWVCALSSGNDGLDANGNLTIDGGTVYAAGSSSPEVGIDANTEGGKKFTFNGGNLVAIGGVEGGSSLNQACYSSSTWSKNSWYALYSGDTLVLTFKTPSSGGSGLIVSASGNSLSLKSGVSVSGGTEHFDGQAFSGATVSGGSSVTLSSYTSSSGYGPGNGGRGPGGWR